MKYFFTKGLTLVEVLISVVILSVLLLYVVNLNADSIKRAKKTELEDQMQNYASEAISLIKNEQLKGWDPLYTTLTTTQQKVVYFTYDSQRRATLKPYLAGQLYYLNLCRVILSDTAIGGNYSDCKGLSTEADGVPSLFGRYITVISNTTTSFELKATVACFNDTCKSLKIRPVEITFYIYKGSN